MKANELVEQTRRRMLLFADLVGTRKAAAEAMTRPGLSTSWVLKFMNGEISNPTMQSLGTLQEALDERLLFKDRPAA